MDCLVNTDAGEVVRVSSATTALEDGRWHDVECRYDGGSGYMVIHVDGVALARDEASGGPVRFVATPALYVGGAPRQATFFGDIARVLIDR